MNNKIFQFKLVLLGESAVGKSSLVLRFVKGQFLDYQESTIGAAFLTQTVCLNDTTVKFEIWDTAGQERYHSLAPIAPSPTASCHASAMPGTAAAARWQCRCARGIARSRLCRATQRAGPTHASSTTAKPEAVAAR
eukprot:m51a1_g933 putative ras-related protein rab-5c isoform x2 (136) ;mRNA; f:234787-236926